MNTEKIVPSDAIIRTAGKDIIKTKTQDGLVGNMTRDNKQATLSHVLHVPNVEHSLISVPTFCDECHTAEYSKNNCIVRKNRNEISIGEQTGGTYMVKRL